MAGDCRSRRESDVHPAAPAAQAWALEDTVDLDVFDPPREAWLNTTTIKARP